MSTAVATCRMNYSEHLTDSLNNPKTTTKLEKTDITNIKKQFFNQPNHDVQQTEIMPIYGGGTDKCARCLKTVYLAEKKAGAGCAFHVKCFSCRTCNRKLDASTLSEHKGEIYCKRCYTRQFGVHGLAQGVTMTTEQSTHENRPSRRSSYSSDLDAPVIANHQKTRRTHSNDSTLRDEHNPVHIDEGQKMFPWKNFVLPDDQSVSKQTTNLGIDHTVKADPHQRFSSIGFQHVIQSPHTDNHNRHSAISGQQDRYEYDIRDDQQTHVNRLSAIVQAPFVPPPSRTNSTIEAMEIPLSPIKNYEQIRNPSPISADNYSRQNSREHLVNKSDSFSPSILNEIYHELHDQRTSTQNADTNMIASKNPVLKHKYSHSTSYEGQQTTPAPQIFYREQRYAHDSSPSANANSIQPPLPTGGYSSSSVHEGVLPDSTSSVFIQPPPYDYLSSQSPQANVTAWRPLSPRQSQQPGSTINELVARSSKLILPSAGVNYSAVGALADSFRPIPFKNDPTNNDFDY